MDKRFIRPKEDFCMKALPDGMEIHIIELRKKLNGSSAMDEWIRFFNVESREELEQMRVETKNPGIVAAIKEVTNMNLTKRIRMEFDAYQKAKRDQRAREAYVRDEGREEGKQEIIRNMIRLKMSDGDIIASTGCTQEQLDAEKRAILDSR